MLQLWNGHNNKLNSLDIVGDDFFNSLFAFPKNNVNYRIKTNTESCMIEIDLPGVKREDIELSTEGTHITVIAKRNDKTYKEVFKVAHTFDTTNVDARLELGVLTLTIPRSESFRSQRIQIK